MSKIFYKATFLTLYLGISILLFYTLGYAEIKTVNVIVGNNSVGTGIINKGTVYVPVHSVTNALGKSCKWNPERKRIVINGKSVAGKAIRYRQVIYIPYYEIANCTGISSIYDGKNNSVIYSYEANASNIVSFMGNAKTIKTASIPKSVNINSNTVAVTPPKGGFIDEPFIPVIGENDVFKVAVTNVENKDQVKAQSVSNPLNKFVIVHLSQQNVSDEVQIYTGKFALMDNKQRIYEYSEGVSNFWLVVLRPGGSNFGYIVFEIPKDSEPAKLILSTTSRPPLALNLK
jgi:hypothetical protein